MHQKEIDVIKKKSNGRENAFLIHMILLLEKMRVPFFGRVKFVHLKRTPFFIRYFLTYR